MQIAPDRPEEQYPFANIFAECDECGANIYDGDPYFKIDDKDYCSECIENSKTFAEW